MHKDDKKVTVPDTSAATDEGQSPSPKTKTSITGEDTEINNIFDLDWNVGITNLTTRRPK